MVVTGTHRCNLSPVRSVSYRDLHVWQQSMSLAVEANRLAHRVPTYEQYGLSNQLRRAAASIPANIAEGHARSHRREYLHHVSIARGSLAELDSHLELALRREYLTAEEIALAKNLADQVGRMLNRLYAALRVVPSP
ncbi:MAG: four helix bundle protein [Gemmatimonadaceae bacterium]